MFILEYREYKDANYYRGYSANNKIEWSEWKQLKSTKPNSTLVINDVVSSSSIELLKSFKKLLEKRQLLESVKKEYRITINEKI